jgi:hypothetical protein
MGKPVTRVADCCFCVSRVKDYLSPTRVTFKENCTPSTSFHKTRRYGHQKIIVYRFAMFLIEVAKTQGHNGHVDLGGEVPTRPI